MKLVVTGEGPDGRSRVEDITEITAITEPKGRGSIEIWSTASFPPKLPFERAKTVDVPEFDLGSPPGAARAGSAELILEDGVVELFAGDTLVMPGIIHQWKVGPEGCVMSGTAYGVEAP